MKVTVKKSRTRFIAIAAALICTLSLTACNSNGTSSQTESSNTVNSSVSADSSTGSSNNSYEAWSDEIVLSNIIPEVKGTVDHTYENTEEKMWIDFDSVDDNQYKDYITACKDRGFTVEEESDSYKFEAFNADGYKLELTHFSSDDSLSVELEAPMEMDEIIFPIGQAGKLVPKPKSTFGKINFEYDNNFCLYLGKTPKSDYNAYVSACIDKGLSLIHI